MFNFRRIRENSKAKLFGAIFGLLIFPGSFIGLFLNEGRINFGAVAEDSIAVHSNTVDHALTGELVAVSGPLQSDETLGDPQFITGGNYIQLDRSVEMFAWHEESSTDSDTDETTYEYIPKWTEDPPDSSTFEFREYSNPRKRIESQHFSVSEAQVGLYTLDARSADFPEPQPLNLNDTTLLADVPTRNETNIEGDNVFIGIGTFAQPEVGDLRVAFHVVLPSASATAFGQAQGEQLGPYQVTDSQALYRVFFKDRDSAIAQMHEEYSAALWAGRFFGFAAMWCGLFLIANPLTILLTIIPLLERFGVWALLAITLPIAAILSTITIIVSFIAHNPWLIVILACIASLVFLAVGGLASFYQRRNSTDIA